MNYLIGGEGNGEYTRIFLQSVRVQVRALSYSRLFTSQSMHPMHRQKEKKSTPPRSLDGVRPVPKKVRPDPNHNVAESHCTLRAHDRGRRKYIYPLNYPFLGSCKIAPCGKHSNKMNNKQDGSLRDVTNFE